eukprot:PhM_4_TR15019/c0_g1_i1/m.33662
MPRISTAPATRVRPAAAGGGGHKSLNSTTTSNKNNTDHAETMSTANLNDPAPPAEYDMLVQRYRQLAVEVHLPLLDHKLYHKYLIVPTTRTMGMFTKLTALVMALQMHKNRTVEVMKRIHQNREETERLFGIVRRYEDGSLTTLEVQTLALAALHDVQTSLLRIVDAVEEWRAGCTRPYAFMAGGENFYFTVLRDMRRLETGALYTALPLPYTQYPLLSNVPSLDLFRGGVVTYPLKRRTELSAGDGAYGSVASSSRHIAKLRRAESILRGEPRRQARLMHDLINISLQSRFVPILNVVADIMPQGDVGLERGIQIQSVAWVDKLRLSLKDSWDSVVRFQRECQAFLEMDDTFAQPPPSHPQQQQQEEEADDGHENEKAGDGNNNHDDETDSYDNEFDEVQQQEHDQEEDD